MTALPSSKRKQGKPISYGLLRDLKLRYKLLFIFIILLILLMNTFFFAWSTAQDSAREFRQIQNYAFPAVTSVNSIKDNLHAALLHVYDYTSTKNPNSKAGYQTAFRQTISAEIEFFQISQSENDFTFISDFNNQITELNTAAEEVIRVTDTNGNEVEKASALQELSKRRALFTLFLEQEVAVKIQNQVTEVSENIEYTANQIQLYLYFAMAAVVVIVLSLVYFLANFITKPIEALTQAARKFGEGTFVPVHLQRRDELGLFAETFNSMGQDILQSKQALEIELEKTKELDRNKTEFISVAAHQLRTPMSGIKWVMAMAADGDLGPISDELKHHLQSGAENADRMIKVINGLLDLSQLEEAKSQFKFTFQDMKRIADEVMNALAMNAKKKEIKIVVSAPKKLPLVPVDEEKIRVALNNLVSNAAKYSKPKGTVTITLKEQGSELLISVIDSGYGIPKDQQRRVFEKFFRANNIVKIETEGSGIGLTIVKDIVEKHDGRIYFVSQENVGTTFTIAIPLKRKKKD